MRPRERGIEHRNHLRWALAKDVCQPNRLGSDAVEEFVTMTKILLFKLRGAILHHSARLCHPRHNLYLDLLQHL